MSRKNIQVTRETETGRNTRFHDPSKRQDMTRTQFVREIEYGNYPGYYVREINGIKTPVSKPDGSTKNKLG